MVLGRPPYFSYFGFSSSSFYFILVVSLLQVLSWSGHCFSLVPASIIRKTWDQQSTNDIMVQQRATELPTSSSEEIGREDAESGSDSSSSQLSMPQLMMDDTMDNPRFRIGVLADIQYAPIPDGYSFAGVLRYYRHSLEVARCAAKHFEESNIDVVLNLGDIIDGKCQDIEKHGGEPVPEGIHPGLRAMEEVLDALSHYQRGPIIHTYGNHELYNFDRDVIGKKLNIPFQKEACGDLAGYWTYPHGGFRFVVIDSYDVTKARRCKATSVKHKEACKTLENENPNYPSNDNSSEGLEGINRRFVAFNGGVGKTQLEWLRKTLMMARTEEEKVIIISHQPILPGSSSDICLIWNYDDVLAVLREFGDVVVASFAGHAHSGGYKRDTESGIHFRTMPAVLENPHPHKTYGIIDVHDDCLVVEGFGNCESACYEFDHLKKMLPLVTKK